MKKVLISLSALMIFWGNMAVAVAELPKGHHQAYKLTKSQLMDHSDIFDDPEFGTSPEVYPHEAH
ncbi:hypothetical protein Bealeia1_01192 [Candidatus Bealeia paramacronuclearis]|uniref:Uncharacterized protein n=1 Tax=Candidatus Bealeia paramacronuclearis TaxID=1921001 RepID=A0ABZ2C3I5_9PROT|nr:hypothetical protein [Candidatus Bealeia paramacronuclearis]